MAKKKKRSGFKTFLIALFIVFVIWAGAFLVWLFWKDIQRFVSYVGQKTTPQQTQKSSQEKISDQERKKLDEILEKR